MRDNMLVYMGLFLCNDGVWQGILYETYNSVAKEKIQAMQYSTEQ